mgnify:CR=1 FL=1
MKRMGWVWAGSMRQPHYIVDGRSLCDRWGWFGSADNSDDPETPPGACSPCKLCWTRWGKLSLTNSRMPEGEREC